MDFLARHKRLSWSSLLGLLLMLIWCLWPDRRLDEVKALRAELFSDQGKKLSADERKGKFEALRKASENLSPAQKQQLAKEGQKRFEQQLQGYAKMSKKEQLAYLDEQIDRMKKAPQKGGPAKGGLGSANFAANKKSLSNADREHLRKQRLDATTPELRALMTQYRKDMQARMAARGVTPPPWMRGRRVSTNTVNLAPSPPSRQLATISVAPSEALLP